jgi:hypothetical protein
MARTMPVERPRATIVSAAQKSIDTPRNATVKPP